MCTDNAELRFPVPGTVTLLSTMPPLRAADFPFPLVLPLLAPLPLFPAPVLPWLNASQTAIAIVYVSSPLPQPALQMRRGLGPSTDLRAQSCGTTCRASAFSAPG